MVAGKPSDTFEVLVDDNSVVDTGALVDDESVDACVVLFSVLEAGRNVVDDASVVVSFLTDKRVVEASVVDGIAVEAFVVLIKVLVIEVVDGKVVDGV